MMSLYYVAFFCNDVEVEENAEDMTPLLILSWNGGGGCGDIVHTVLFLVRFFTAV